MQFSLIVPTIGRTAELERLLGSLVVQTYKDFEVIVVDQNPDDRVARILKPYLSKLAIQHLAEKSGASRARNRGLKAVNGDVVAFPDDDCWYPADLIEQVYKLFLQEKKNDGIICHSEDEFGKASMPWNDKTGPVSPALAWRRSPTYSYFLKKNVVDKVGAFDEKMGPGAGTSWGTGEDADYILRALKHGFNLYFSREIIVRHPKLFLSFDDFARQKNYRYSMADGHLLKKHPMPLWWKLAFFGVPLARMFWSALMFSGDEVRFHWLTFTGRYHGYFRHS